MLNAALRLIRLMPQQDPWMVVDPRGTTAFTYDPQTTLHPDFIPTRPTTTAELTMLLATVGPAYRARHLAGAR
jgi:hypothetical protein